MLVVGLLAGVARFSPWAGLDRGAALLLVSGLVTLGIARRLGRWRRTALACLGLVLVLGGAARELLVREARGHCRSAVSRAAPGPERAIVLDRPLESGRWGWLIRERGPRRCADLLSSP